MVESRLYQSQLPPRWDGWVVLGLEEADARVRSWIASPPPALSPFFEGFGYLEFRLGKSSLPFIAAPIPIVSMQYHSLLDTASTGVSESPPGGTFSKPSAKFTAGVLTGDFRVLVLHFTPGGFFALFGDVMQKLTARSDVLQKLPFALPSISSAQWGLAEADLWVQEMEEFCISRLAKSFEPKGHLSLIANFIKAVETGDGSARIQEIIQEFSVSERSFQRICKKEVQLSPWEFVRVIRLHQTLKRLRSGSWRNYGHLASECGFTDQSHMIREFRKLLGDVPRRFLNYQ